MLKFLKENYRWIAGGFLLTYFSSFGQTFFISGSISEWRAAFDLSHGDFGRLYMFATLASALCLPFAGRLVDVMPVHRLILLVMPVLAVATLVAAYAPSLAVLIFAIFVLRLFGQGMMTHIALTATGRWFSAQRGRAVSLVVLGHQGGEATLPLLFAGLAATHGYRSGWLAGTLLLLLGLPLAYLAYRQPRTPQLQAAEAKTAAPAVRSWTRTEVLRDPVFWVLLTGVLAPPFIGTTIFYHQDYLAELGGWPPQFFALSLSLMAITTVVFALVSGALIDRFRAAAVLPFFLLPLGASCFVLSINGPAELLFLVMMLLGISYGFSSTLSGAVWPEIYGVAHLGAIRSVIVSAMVFSTAAGPGITGTLIDAGVALPEQMRWLGGYCLAAALALGLASLHIIRSPIHARA
ncbi:MAG: MFS transporter [Woeseiaceae bacterium]|nr:MFS transporter [Woeseiaceae bacterium]